MFELGLNEGCCSPVSLQLTVFWPQSLLLSVCFSEVSPSDQGSGGKKKPFSRVWLPEHPIRVVLLTGKLWELFHPHPHKTIITFPNSTAANERFTGANSFLYFSKVLLLPGLRWVGLSVLHSVIYCLPQWISCLHLFLECDEKRQIANLSNQRFHPASFSALALSNLSPWSPRSKNSSWKLDRSPSCTRLWRRRAEGNPPKMPAAGIQNAPWDSAGERLSCSHKQ